MEKDKIREIIRNYLSDKPPYYPWDGPGIEYQDERGEWHWLKATRSGSTVEVIGLEGVHIYKIEDITHGQE